jgi:hypothetical protein
MMAGGRGVEAGVDANEENAQAGRQDVADSLARGGGEIGPARPA